MLTADPSDPEAHSGRLFNPPLWIQRRALVSQILKANDSHSVLDLGCGEGSLLEILLNEAGFTTLAGVDIDPAVLGMAAHNCLPTAYDKQYLRELPVDFNLYQGSVAEVDERLMGFDAIASIEVVEHLDPAVLAAFPKVTLGGYKPRTMVVTTPNADFNVNFTDLKHGTADKPMRHWDHRFEWTRAEFQKWACAAAAEYNYSVRFTGVGILTSGLGNEGVVGQCTQVAIFERLDISPNHIAAAPPKTPQHTTPYKHLGKIEFPYFTETGFTSADVLRELKERIPSLVWNDWHSRWADARAVDKKALEPAWPVAGEITLPVDELWNILRIRQLCKRRDRLVELLGEPETAALFALSENGKQVEILFAVPKEDLSAKPSRDRNQDSSEEEDGYDEYDEDYIANWEFQESNFKDGVRRNSVLSDTHETNHNRNGVTIQKGSGTRAPSEEKNLGWCDTPGSPRNSWGHTPMSPTTLWGQAPLSPRTSWGGTPLTFQPLFGEAPSYSTKSLSETPGSPKPGWGKPPRVPSPGLS
ncbi:hypothetical protein PhCBS80983_g04427 [Powellomyces hirtus]|uniref:Small RNA 2'-O-methyltransferase n=1 Tax=Powellomyces hirtus TaxID=109895 RepID=A0A507E061_9FUNG|nr:hypothetical protein PhCBS80983_g04427 [Powellomyces hirtus]